jgi:hypothetical protein
MLAWKRCTFLRGLDIRGLNSIVKWSCSQHFLLSENDKYARSIIELYLLWLLDQTKEWMYSSNPEQARAMQGVIKTTKKRDNKGLSN